MAKTFSFAIVHMSVAFGVGYLMTGSVAVGSALALVEPLVNSVAYFFHEKAWSRFERRAEPAQAHADFMPRAQPVPAN
ncbi:MAG: DUF2061 domain-containing protein [Burkholderiales bacterium]|nr:DUF2061 domain-containing protein [Burkholderiales bacterium]